MCLLITLAFTALFFVLMKLDHENRYSVRLVFITFLSASIMWGVDGVWRVTGGEPFLGLRRGRGRFGLHCRRLRHPPLARSHRIQ